MADVENGGGCDFDDCCVVDIENVGELVVLLHCCGWLWKVFELKVLGRKWF